MPMNGKRIVQLAKIASENRGTLKTNIDTIIACGAYIKNKMRTKYASVAGAKWFGPSMIVALVVGIYLFMHSFEFFSSFFANGMRVCVCVCRTTDHFIFDFHLSHILAVLPFQLSDVRCEHSMREIIDFSQRI